MIMQQQPVISIRNLGKHYGDKVALDNVNLDIYPGQVIGYIGPNGAGKSTTVKILTGLISHFNGSVTILGMDLREQDIEIKKRIGYVPENAELYELLTPREYLHFIGGLHEMPETKIDERMERMLQAFGLENNLDERMDTFSKGMRQKVLLTAGLLHNPDIIILDEPLSGLDANSVIIIKELLGRLKQEGKTIFYCSHMMDVVEKVSDLIVLIKDGRVVAEGTIDQLRQFEGQSLEQLFAKLTVTEDLNRKADNLARAIGQ
jgi:ABC-2 type transport system ATP-binding protein